MTVRDNLSPFQTIAVQRNPRRWLMLIIVLLATLMDGIDNFIVNVALPSIQRELQTSFAEVQLVAAGYILSTPMRWELRSSACCLRYSQRISAILSLPLLSQC